eukprot:g37486.t1
MFGSHVAAALPSGPIAPTESSSSSSTLPLPSPSASYSPLYSPTSSFVSSSINIRPPASERTLIFYGPKMVFRQNLQNLIITSSQAALCFETILLAELFTLAYLLEPQGSALVAFCGNFH